MLNNLRINTEARKIDNLPEGWVTLFLAKTTYMSPLLYVAVIGPKKACLSTNEHPSREFGGVAKLVQFTAENIRVTDVLHGHKYQFGGGMIQTEKFHPERGVIWTTQDECGRTEVFGRRISPDDILIAL